MVPKSELSLRDRIDQIEIFENELRRRVHESLSTHDAMYHADWFMIGALKRTFAQSKGFRDLIAAHNFPCAAAILRMQLDTAMRLNALHLVDDIDALCRAVLDGQRMSQLKDRSGNKMSDFHLRKKLGEHHPWIEEVYIQTSDFVHLSGRHFYSSVNISDKDTRAIRIVISAEDPPRPDECYFEIVDSFLEASKIAGLIILGYLDVRALAAEQVGESHEQ